MQNFSLASLYLWKYCLTHRKDEVEDEAVVCRCGTAGTDQLRPDLPAAPGSVHVHVVTLRGAGQVGGGAVQVGLSAGVVGCPRPTELRVLGGNRPAAVRVLKVTVELDPIILGGGGGGLQSEQENTFHISSES